MPTRTAAAGAATGARFPARWVGGLAGAAAVVCVIGGVQLATGGGVEPSGDGRPVAAAPAAHPSPAAAGEDVAASAEVAAAPYLFPAGGVQNSDTVRTSTVDVGATWPVRGCLAMSAADASGDASAGDASPGDAGPADGAPVEVGRVDFVSGTEEGPEYSRDLAIGWYADAAAAQAAYDALVALVGQCAAEAGASTAAAPWTPSATAGSLLTVWSTIEGPFAEGSTYAVAVRDAVVVLAADHSELIVSGPEAPAGFPGTAGHADRLLTEACRVAPGRC